MPWTEKLEQSSLQIPARGVTTGNHFGSLKIHITAFIYLAALTLAIMDNAVQNLRVNALFFALGALAALDWNGGRDALRRLLFVVPAIVVSVVLSLILNFVAPQSDSLSRAAHALGRNEVYLIWPISLWLFAPFLPQMRRDPAHFTRDTSPRILLVTASAALLLGAWDFATSFSSVQPMLSFRDFQREIGIYIPFLLFWIRRAPEHPRLQHLLKLYALPILALAVVIPFALGTAYALGSEDLRSQIESTRLARKSLILKEKLADLSYETRLQFPFGHHNRMGYFSMLCVLLFSGVAWIQLNRRHVHRHRYVIAAASMALAAMAFCNMALTMNRGAALATGGGILLSCLWIYGKRALPLLLLPFVLLLVVPSSYRTRVWSAFQAKTYQDRDSSAGKRIRHFAAAGQTIARFPLSGVGYGWHNYERYYRSVLLPESGRKDTEALHAHNIWLEQAAETGVAGAILLFPCIVTPFVFYAAFARRSKDRKIRANACLWVGLGFAINVYGTVNHPLRESVGLITWGIIAGALADYGIESRRRDELSAETEVT